MNTFVAIGFAMIAAVGNALFVAAQKKSAVFDPGIGFITCSLLVALILLVCTAPLFGSTSYQSVIRQGGGWMLLSGFGLFLVYLGFYLLYTRFGASYYVLYAVLSILTTVLVVGVWLYRESFNPFHWAAMLCAIATVILFALADRQ